jgi:hypothetical protein
METVIGYSNGRNAFIDGTLHRTVILLDLAVPRLLRRMDCLAIGLKLAVTDLMRTLQDESG